MLNQLITIYIMQTHGFIIPAQLPRFQQQWLLEVVSYIMLSDSSAFLNVAEVAKAAGVSERQFYRQIKQWLGITPNELIQRLRLEKAGRMLESGAYATVAEVAYAAGFNCPDYFSNLFYKKYGIRPTELLWKTARAQSFGPDPRGFVSSHT